MEPVVISLRFALKIKLVCLVKYSENRCIELNLYGHIVEKVIGYLKMNVSKEIHKQNPLLEVWRRGYTDHIVRNQTDFEYHWNYIEYNALKEYN